ncbi:MAG TPA: helix-turn-helix transcriptional regulator, partial [Chryseolinea sp.]|nr:helix-turn-helix transcriptional regulator [Chryseolinea sp.]
MKQPELGKKIVELRTAKGLTQEELVELCNISIRTIQRIENGEVTPRSFTVKTILAALGHDFDKIAELESSKPKSGVERLLLTDLNSAQPPAFVLKQLNIAWIFGVLYFILGFLEGPAEYFRAASDEMIFGRNGYVVIKVLVLLAYVFFQRGFFIMGALFNNYLLRITSIVLIGSMVLVQGFEIVSAYNDAVDPESVMFGASLSFGAIGILFGIALAKLNHSLGVISLLAAAFEIIAAILFLTVVLSFVGFFVLIPAELLEIILIYKAIEVIKDR